MKTDKILEDFYNFLSKFLGKQKNENITQYFMKIGCYILGVSAFIDLLLWLLTGYLVPSWTLSVLMLMNIVFIWFLRGKIK